MSDHAVRLMPSVFKRPGAEGDFAWMIQQPHYARALFVFNDNESQFRALMAGLSPGGGNAIIRPFQSGRPRAAGVPTGPGYDSLKPAVKSVIDQALTRIDGLIQTGDYELVIYSADPTDPELLGHGIFDVGKDVRRYIVATLKQIVTSATHSRSGEP